jgi:hypothetical protein
VAEWLHCELTRHIDTECLTRKKLLGGVAVYIVAEHIIAVVLRRSTESQSVLPRNKVYSCTQSFHSLLRFFFVDICLGVFTYELNPSAVFLIHCLINMPSVNEPQQQAPMAADNGEIVTQQPVCIITITSGS